MNTALIGVSVPEVSPSLDAISGPNAPRDRRGRLLPGAKLARTHGLYTAADFERMRGEIETFRQASVADDGGETEVGTRRLSLHGYRARVHRRIEQIDEAIEVRGLFDKRGKLRHAWLSKLESLIATARSLDQLLGLERRSKLASSPREAIAAIVAARGSNGHTQPGGSE